MNGITIIDRIEDVIRLFNSIELAGGHDFRIPNEVNRND